MNRRSFPRKALGRLLALALAAAMVIPAAALSGPHAVSAANAPPKVFMGYWARWGDDPAPKVSLAANISRIDFFSPYWYTLHSNGSLGSRESDHAGLTDMVHASGNMVLPLINKTSDNSPLWDPGTRAAAVENIYRLLIDHGYDGVNIDFEGMPPSTRDGLTAFMTELAAKLRPAGLLTTIAVPAKWSNDESTNDFAIPYDYAALGRVVDYLVIMTYDQHAEWSGPGPIAGADWVENVLRYATSVVPAQKILLGLAGYGYDWGDNGSTSGVSAVEAAAKAARYGATIEWDSVAHVPHFSYWTGSGARHEVWYENSYSVDFKIVLANRYGVGGVALWALGQEDGRFWQVISGQAGSSGGLGGTPTPGGSGSGGGSGGAGSGSGSDRPGGGGASPGGGTPAAGFGDVPAGYWAHDAIMKLAAAGAVGGPGASGFEPDRPVTRAEFASLIARAFGLAAPEPGSIPFKDIAATDWFFDSVLRVARTGLMAGFGNETFGPSLTLTREQAAVIAARAGDDLPVPDGAIAPRYTDAALISSWAYPSVTLASLKGLLQGYPDGSFRPQKAVTRAEAAVLIGRLKP